jgi:RHS repeat-associated protein
MFSPSSRKFNSLLLLPALLPLMFLTYSAAPNSPPVAVDDAYTVHGGTQLTPSVLANDSDPDGDGIHFDSYGSQPQHGRLVGSSGSPPTTYSPNFGYTGTDSFTYRICDDHNACSGYATVTFNVVNSAPVAGDDTFTVHGGTQLSSVLANDSDPDGDGIRFDSYGSQPQHGYLVGSSGSSPTSYTPNSGYTGTDSFTYRICDDLGACSAYATVTLNVVNSAPVAVDDSFTVHGGMQLSSVLVNDYDPNGDGIRFDSYGSQPQHGYLVGSAGSPPISYSPNSGYTGTDSFTYRICDDLGACSNYATVTFFVVGDGENNGGCNECNGAVGALVAVGKPINVTNGNMYLQQGDYQLPSVGFGMNVTRTYNSDSQRIGLFGRGWATAYDESILAYDNNMVRFNQGDGRAIYFARPVGSSDGLAPLEGDFHGSLSQNGGSGFTLSFTDGSAQEFNSAGKLLSLNDRNGNTTTLTYGGNGFLSSVTDPFGRVLTVTTNAAGQVTSISDTLGTVATYLYGGSSELLSVIYADNSAFNFSYDGSLRLTTVTDALGNIVESHSYDGQGRALTSEKQGGVEHYSLSYVSSTETDVTDALGRITKFTFDTTKGRNVVTKVEGLCSCGGGNNSQVQTWTYDSQLNVMSKTDALGHVMSYSYDGNGNRLTETDPTGTVTYTYNGFAEVLTRTDQLNFVNANTFDGTGKLLTTTDALGNATTFTNNARGQMLTATDARGKVTNLTYDASGNLTQRQDANSIITFFFYDARSRLTKVRDGLSRSTLFAYDPFGRINKVTHPDLSFVSFRYDLAGRRTRVTDEIGNPTNYVFDGAYRLTGVTDAANQTTGYAYDAMSNPTTTTDALSRVTNYDYDDFNRLVKITYPPAETGATRLFEAIAYDADGNVSQRTDTAGRMTSYAYDNVNRVTGTTDAANQTTGFQYDALSRVTSLTDAINQQYQFTYDAVGRQTQATRGGVSMSHAYDAAGNRTQRTDYNGTVTNYAYDNLNRLTTIVYPTRTVTFSYDPLNNLTRATNENGSVYIGYDNRYRVSSVSDPFYYGISYNYDTVGNRTKLKVNGSTYATYTYDAVNRLTSLKDGANLNFAYSYDAANRLTSRSAPNGVASSYSYDNLDRLTSLMHMAGATTLSGNLYTYNYANNITSWTTASTQRAYAYDAVDRLTGASNFETPTENYSYDAVGNRTASHLSASYGYQPFNKLSSTASATYSYDNNGNLTSRTDSLGTWTFGYDEENRLTQVTIPSGPTVNYKYDGLGRRIQRTTSAGASERYVYDGNDALLDLNADWSVATTYFNGLGIDDHLRQSNSTTGVSYFLTDHLGSTNALTDVNGNVVEQSAYDSFGNSGGSTRTRYGYTGRERDPDTGMLYYRARFYDPQLGRFISEDPAGLMADINAYAYVGNDPIQWADPSGLCSCGVKRGPEYFVVGGWGGGSVNVGGGSVSGGTKFYFHAEFLKDATHDPKCCEVRQLISWNKAPFGGNTVPHAGFTPGTVPGTWTEDRNQQQQRYGRRAGPYSKLYPYVNYYHGNEYDGWDRPYGFPPGVVLKFRLIVVDVCQGGKKVYTSKTLTVNF